MNPRLFLTSSLLVLVLAASCAPAEDIPPALPGVDSAPPSATPSDPPVPEATAASSPTQSAKVQVVPTSLGPNLHATDPTTVSLASGGLQLIEFFRFT